MSTIEERVAVLEAKLAAMAKALGGGMTMAGNGGGKFPTPVAGSVADDRELDSERGNPVLKKDPPLWKGQSCVGQTYSACPPDYLDALASFLDWKAGKNEAEGTEEKLKFAGYDRKDAARARGWAARLRRAPEPDADALFGDAPF